MVKKKKIIIIIIIEVTPKHDAQTESINLTKRNKEIASRRHRNILL